MRSAGWRSCRLACRNRKVTRCVGCASRYARRRAKLMEALIRLAQGHSVLRVALELGYGSHSAFSAMFRRVMGVAPSDYFRPST